jgi:hypothetical protein
MKRWLVALLLLASPAWAQTPSTQIISALRPVAVASTAGMGTASITVDGTWTGTITFEVSNGAGWSSLLMTPPGTTTAVTTTTANGQWAGSVAGWTDIRARFSTPTSGTPSITIATAPTGGGSGSGGAGGGSVTANFTLQEADDATIAAGQTADAIVNMNYWFDGSGWKRYTFGTAGTASAQVTTVQGIASMTPLLTTLSGTNNIATVTTVSAVSAVTPGTGAGNLGKAEDAAHTTADTLIPTACVRKATTPSDRSAGATDDDYEPCQVDGTGRLYVNAALYTANGDAAMNDTADAVKTLSVDATGATIAATTLGTQDTALGTITSVTGSVGMCRASAAPPTAVSADDDATLISCTRKGEQYVTNTDGTNLELVDPCESVAQTTTPISLTTDTVIIAAVSAKKNYICSISIVAAAAEIVSITEGTGVVCGTGEAAIVGSTTDANGMSLAANGGLVKASTKAVYVGKTANVDTCLNVSGSNRIAGEVTWVQR